MLLRNSNIFNNTIESTFRKRRALSFRKTLGLYNYKIKPGNYFRNTHAMDLKTKETLKEQGDRGQRKIKAIESMSLRPFGKFTRKSRFIMEKQRMPLYNIPSTRGFYVRNVD